MKKKKKSIIALLAPMYIFTILFVGLPILYMFLLYLASSFAISVEISCKRAKEKGRGVLGCGG